MSEAVHSSFFPSFGPSFTKKQGSSPLIISSPLSSSQRIKNRVCEIPSSILEVTKDERWLQLLLEALGFASQICSWVNTKGGMHAISVMGMVAAPIYIPQAFKSAYERILNICSAIKSHQFALGFFWGARMIDAVGAAFGTLTRSLASGLKLMEKANIFIGGLFCTLILPILLIVVGFIGGVAQGVSLVRSIRALQKLNQASQKTEDFMVFLNHLQNPSLEAITDPRIKAKMEVDRQLISDDFFPDDKRREFIQNHLRLFLIQEGNAYLVGSIQKALSPGEIKLIEKIQKAQKLFASFQSSSASLPTQMSELIELSESTLALYYSNEMGSILDESEKREFSDLVSKIQFQLDKLKEAKRAYASEEMETVSLLRAEMHRGIFNNAMQLMIAILTLASGILALIITKNQAASTSLSLTASGLTVFNVLFEKLLSQKNFYSLYCKFHPLKDVNTNLIDTSD